MSEDLEISGSADVAPIDFPDVPSRPKVDEKDLLDYTDYDKFRDTLKTRTLNAVNKAFPISNEKYTLRVADLHYGKGDTYSLAQQKKAILDKQSLTHTLKGNWEVVDNATGGVVKRSKPKTILNVPYITPRGTYIRRGTEYTINKQLRLRPGVYSRFANDGTIETQFNVKHGTGSMFKTFMDPSKSLFYLKKQGKKIPMLPVLRAMGVPEENIKKAWGEEIYQANTATLRSPHAINFLKQYVSQQPLDNKTASIDYASIDKDRLISDFSGDVEADVVNSTMGRMQGRIDPSLILESSSKHLRMSKGKEDADERDSLEFQSIADMSDYLSEKIEKDQSRIMRNHLWKLTGKGGDADYLSPGVLDKHVDHIFNKSNVSQAIEMINPADYYDQAFRVSRLGEGAMSSLDVAPKDSRNVQPSYLNYIDAIRSPESMKIGLDMRLARNVRRGPNNLLYTKFVNAKTGETEWVDSLTASRANVATPEYMGKDTKYVPSVTHKGTKNIPRAEVDYYVPSGDDMFSEIASTVPLKSGVKGMRLLMGCLTHDTQIAILRRGTIHTFNIGDYSLEEGDMTYSINEDTWKIEWAPVQGVKENTDTSLEVLEITLKTGRKLRTTTNHKWVTLGDDGKLLQVEASDLKKGMSIPRAQEEMPLISSDVLWDKVKNIEYVEYTGHTFDLDLGDRTFMAGPGIFVHNSKFSLAALPLAEREAPHVRTTKEKGSMTSMESKLGKHMGAVFADEQGEVVKVSPNGVKVKYADGTVKDHELYNNMPFARMTYMRSIPRVKKGDKIEKGAVLASSNYTNDKGVTAVGRNLRTAYWGYEGQTFEDNIVISEAAARKMTSEHMYTEDFEKDKDTTTSVSKFKALYPTKFSPKQLANIDDNGAVKKGTVLNYGDPIVLGVTERKGSETLGRKLRSDASKVWKHKFPGVVTDVSDTQKGFNVGIRANVPMQDGDKLSIRQGGKGVVTLVKDEDMPRDAQGRPLEVIMSPHGIISRTNSAQLVEAQLGKIAAKTGKSYTLDGFMEEDMVDFAQKELDKHGMSDKEDIFNPKTGKNVPGIFTGNLYYYKQQHTAEKGGKARALGGYTEDEQPGKGCFPGNQQILTMHGMRRISNIVEKRQSEHVWTHDEERGEWCFKPVTDWFVYDSPVSDILSISVDGAASTCGGKRVKHTSVLNPTYNHMVFTYDGRKIMAGELTLQDELISWGPVATAYQKQFLAGSLLGDAYMSPGAYQCMHSVKQDNYTAFKQTVVSGLFGDWKHIKSEGTAPNGKSHKRVLMSVYDKPTLRFLQDMCYVDGKKRVTRKWLEYIGDIGLCAWLLDDASISARNPAGSRGHYGELATQGFTLEECELISEFLCERLGEDTARTYPLKEGTQSKIVFRAEGVRKLVDILAEHIPHTAVPRSKRWLKAEMEKRQKHSPAQRVDNICNIGKIPCPIRSIKPYKDPKGRTTIKVYDFTVDHTHRYTAGNVLVSNSKHLGVMEQQALLGHGATEVLKDMKLVKGQKNDGFWRQMMLGQTPDAPRTPLVYAKFKDMLKAAGIQMYEGKNSDNIMAMTNKGAIDLTKDRQIQNANTYSQSNFKPMDGGLFDPKLTDSKGDGKRWSYVQLPEPMVNPIMLDPIRRILGLTNKEANSHIRKGTFNDLAKRIDVGKVKEQALDNIRNGAKTKRDDAIKQFRAVVAMEKAGTKPSDYLMERVPVLPPKYRPITQSHGMNMVNDANYMYSSLMHTASDFNDAEGLTGDIRDDARDTMYKTYSALVGLTDPVQEELQKKNIGGILRNVIGKGSPKLGFIQRRVLGAKMDATAAAVITPNPALKLNQVGLPEDKAYDLYEPFIIRNLVQSGMSGLGAAKAVKQKTKQARKALEEVATQRPVIVNRAPSLHKYSVMAMWPRIVKGKTLQIPPTLVAPFGADFDGDKMSYSVPVSKAAVDEAIQKMMPDKNLLSDSTGDASYVPGIEFLQGLHLSKKTARKGKHKKVFSSLKEAKKAYSKGEINIDDPIEIREQQN